MGNKQSDIIKEQEKQIRELQEQNMKILLILQNVYQKLDFEKDEKTKVTIEGKEYEFKEKLGQGAFGIVYKAVHNNKIYAVKEIEVSEENSLSILQELKFIQLIRENFSENILPVITIYGVSLVDERRLYYAMEFATMPLQKLFDNISTSELRYDFGIIIYLFVLKALLFLESIEVVHSDIKPDNFVVIDDPSSQFKMNIKLIDFGTAKKLELHKSKLVTASIAGTLYFLAPEAFNGIVHKKSDVWSLGIMMYRLIYNSFPDYTQDERSIQLFAISDKEINFAKCPDTRFESLLHVTKQCLTKNVDKRPLASDLYKFICEISPDLCKLIIQNNFVKNSNAKELGNKYKMMQTKIAHAPAVAPKNEPKSQRRCFIRECSAVLPQNHQFNRCNNCFNTRCLDCYKKHTAGYKYKRCPDCYSKFRRK